jgi:2',3'-cyclic-nucleotide 2'-phosphodiesterase/3'-nucleotidase
VTTDLHSNAVNYDYYQDKSLDRFGLAKVATLVEAHRTSGDTIFLLDNGDLIQGTPLADTRAQMYKDGDRSGSHPMIRLMNHMGYDAATVGNHEFNYGLDYLRWVLGGAAFSYVCSNILNVGEHDGLMTLLPPYAIIERIIDGAVFRLGVVGFVPPQIMQWDKVHLNGHVKVLDIQVAAKMFVPQLRARKVDAVVALSHSGLVFGAPGIAQENSSFALTRINDIDVVVAGHTHDLFPSEDFAGLEDLGVDLENGTIGDKAVVMPGFWGSHLGVVKLEVSRIGDRWRILSKTSGLEPTDGVAPHPEIERLIRAEHHTTQVRMRASVGRTSTRLHTYFARVCESSAVDLINESQLWYARRVLAGTEHANLPLLAVSPPFRAGFAGPGDFTDIPIGEVAMQHIADLYLYPNSFACVLANGSQIMIWLERAAENFALIDPKSPEPQSLLNLAFPTYNFDTFSGIEYSFDVTKDVGQRVKDVVWQGAPLQRDMVFVVATNSYRANGGGRFPGLTGNSIIYESPQVSSDVLLEYIRACGEIQLEKQQNWRISPFRALGTVFFEAPAAGLGLGPKWLVCENPQDALDRGTLRYRVDFGADAAEIAH